MTWDRRLYSPPPPNEDVLLIFIALENPSLSAGFESANLVSSGKHDNLHTTKNDTNLGTLISWRYSLSGHLRVQTDFTKQHYLKLPKGIKTFPFIHLYVSEIAEEWFLTAFFLYYSFLIHNKTGIEFSCRVL
jgi:hypothetical protein